MDIQSILNELREQVARLDNAISALERTNGSTGKRRGRKPKRKMSEEAKARIGAAARKRWAAAKKAGKATLAG